MRILDRSDTRSKLSRQKIDLTNCIDLQYLPLKCDCPRGSALRAIAHSQHSCLTQLYTRDARIPQGRIATLDITYLDETLRIGRGGDRSLFILCKSDDSPHASLASYKGNA